ncbi:hypothetical protein X740_07910 [Mesorhizobium sp. LNHC221B00]|nr:hypothetical protein X740_07910 [Mesorhizobium sp. LNHC221B00]
MGGGFSAGRIVGCSEGTGLAGSGAVAIFRSSLMVISAIRAVEVHLVNSSLALGGFSTKGRYQWRNERHDYGTEQELLTPTAQPSDEIL